MEPQSVSPAVQSRERERAGGVPLRTIRLPLPHGRGSGRPYPKGFGLFSKRVKAYLPNLSAAAFQLIALKKASM
jgi:hypothetical protein